MKKPRLQTALIIAISLVYVLLFILPYSLGYRVGDEGRAGETWVKYYIMDDIVTIIIFVPFALFWLPYLLLQPGLAKTILKVLLVIICGLFFIFSFLGLMMPSPDVLPHAGVFLSAMLLPLLVWLLVVEHRSHTNAASSTE